MKSSKCTIELTAQEGTDLPDNNWTQGGELSNGHFHEDNRHSTEQQKSEVRNEEDTCGDKEEWDLIN